MPDDGDLHSEPKIQSCDRSSIPRLNGGSEPSMQYDEVVKALKILSIPHPSTGKRGLPKHLDFFLSTRIWDDHVYSNDVPVLSKGKAYFAGRLLRIPSHELFTSIVDRVGWQLSEEVAGAKMDELWSTRRPKVFWRGGMRSYSQCVCDKQPRMENEAYRDWHFSQKANVLVTETSYGQPCGCQNHFPINNTNYKQHNRIRLCTLGAEHPDMIDAKFSYIPETYDDIRPMLLPYLDSGGFSGFKAALEFKYLISTDGSTIDDTRVYWSFLSGGLVFKQITPLVPVGIPSMIPHVHYIPVREDLGDLVGKIRWAMANDDRCRLIAKNGFEFAWQHYRQQSMMGYFGRVLNKYAERFPAEDQQPPWDWANEL